MSHHSHLPIYTAVFGFLKELYMRVPKFAKQYKYLLGEKLIGYTIDIISLIIEANNQRGVERQRTLTNLAEILELLILYVRMAEELNQWGSQKAYLFLSEKLVNISIQAEGWRKSTGTS